MTTQAQIHADLVKALGLIEREADWCGDGWGEGGRRCVGHALCTAISGLEELPFDDPLVSTRFMPAAEVLSKVVGRSGGFAIATFNDRSPHSAVIRAVHAAIAATAPEPDTDWLNEVRVEEPVAS